MSFHMISDQMHYF